MTRLFFGFTGGEFISERPSSTMNFMQCAITIEVESVYRFFDLYRCGIKTDIASFKSRWFLKWTHCKSLTMYIIYTCIIKRCLSQSTVLCIMTYHRLNYGILLKADRSDCVRFSSNFRRFCYQKKAHIFSLPLVNCTAEKCTVWKILMKMRLVMVTIIKLTQ